MQKENASSATLGESMVMSSRYNTEEKRRKHAEYQKRWREANYAKVLEIEKRSRQREMQDPYRKERRETRLKASRKTPTTLKRRLRQKTRRYQKTANAMNSRRRWSDSEIETAFSRDLTDTQIGEMLGRSVQAIALARIRYADRAPIGWTPKSTPKA